jgi:uncharacterized protein YjiS (DUF1127 family)
MATFVNSTNIASNGLVDRLLSSFPSLAKSLAKRRLYAQTVFELNQLTDRELADLGISRLAISDLAREAANGK